MNDLIPARLTRIPPNPPAPHPQVQDSLSLERAYILFRSMGLRHLVVVDDHNHVQGIVTRKDLMGFRLDEALTKVLRRVQSATQLGQQDWVVAGNGAEGGGGGGGAGGSGGHGGGGWGERGAWQAAGQGQEQGQEQQEEQQRPGRQQQQQQQQNGGEGLPVSINPIW